MLTVIKYTLIEAFHRRVALLQLVTGLVIFPLIMSVNHVEADTVGQYVMVNGHRTAAGLFARDVMFVLFETGAGFWVLLGFFSIAPLLTSYLATGMSEMLFTKGISRWKIFTARYIGANLVWGLS